MSLDKTTTCCDALTATSVPKEAFDLLRGLLDDVLLVDESAIKPAVRYLLSEEGVLAEPGAAVGMAAIQEGQVEADGTLLILSGRNVSLDFLAESKPR